MKSIYRNTRTANGLKPGVRVEWDTPKAKRTTKKKFDSVEFLRECLADKEAYSDTERKAFRKIIEEIENLKAEVAGYEDEKWSDVNTGALGRFLEERD
jgi:pullulanase/glycogen debranching enzyme